MPAQRLTDSTRDPTPDECSGVPFPHRLPGGTGLRMEWKRGWATPTAIIHQNTQPTLRALPTHPPHSPIDHGTGQNIESPNIPTREPSLGHAVNQILVPAELIEELDLGSARGGKAGAGAQPLEVEVIRALAESDLEAITNPPLVSAPLAVVKSLKASHHNLAQLIAEGKSGAEIHLTTGYSQSYISNIQHDPAFNELISYYGEQRRTIFIDAQERLRLLGLDATEKLHEQLHDPAQTWSKRELMELIDRTMPVSGSKSNPNQGQPAGGGVSLEIKFVGAQPAGGPVVEASFRDVTPGGAQ